MDIDEKQRHTATNMLNEDTNPYKLDETRSNEIKQSHAQRLFFTIKNHFV